MKAQQIRSDFKRLFREPIIMMLFLAPLVSLIAIKILLLFVVPLLRSKSGFDLSPWYGYVLSAVLLLSPGMLGAVTGFMMIDDRDERMTDLLSITPLGYGGYLFNRLMMPFVMSMVYTLLGYFTMQIYPLDWLRLLLISILTGIESVIVGLLLFVFSDNKVKGLTYAKGMSALMLTCLADLAGIPWLSALCGILPFYWVTQIVMGPLTFLSLFLTALIHLLWLGVCLSRVYRW